MLDLRKFTEEFITNGCHSRRDETVADKAVISAINERDLNPTDRIKQIVKWLNRYKVLMSFPQDARIAIADQIIGFADERHEKSLRRDKDRIVSEFNRLKERIGRVAPPTRTGKRPVLTSPTSKALWCCYPDDIPIFDRNAASALRVISRLCRKVPEPNLPKYACFVDLWFQVYNEVEPVISQADLSGCPYKVRVLDRVLWYLGQDNFYDESVSSTAT